MYMTFNCALAHIVICASCEMLHMASDTQVYTILFITNLLMSSKNANNISVIFQLHLLYFLMNLGF